MIGGKIIEGEPIVKRIFKIPIAPDTSSSCVNEVGGFGFDKLDKCLIAGRICLIAKQAVRPEVEDFFSVDYPQPASIRGLGSVNPHSIY